MISKLLKRLCLVAVAALVPGSAVVADTAQPLRLLLDREEGRKWQAVGRIDIEGAGFCTGSLIAEDLVLTAGHCLYDPFTSMPIAPERIVFRAGWRNGHAAASRQVRQAVVHPEYDYYGRADATRVRHDLALLRLSRPIDMARVVPFMTDARPRAGQAIGVVSYAHDRSEVPALQETCHVKARQNGILIMSCDVDFGASGAPVFAFSGGHPRIVSVVSAKAAANGLPVSLGTELERPLDVLKEALFEQSHFVSLSSAVRNFGAEPPIP